MEGTGCPSKSENSKTIKDNIEYLLGNPALLRFLIIDTTAVYLRLVNNNKKIEGLSFLSIYCFYRNFCIHKPSMGPCEVPQKWGRIFSNFDRVTRENHGNVLGLISRF